MSEEIRKWLEEIEALRMPQPAQAPKFGLYGAEYWVPENHMFKTGIECLEAFPNAGPACGIISTEACRHLQAQLKDLDNITSCTADIFYKERTKNAELRQQLAIAREALELIAKTCYASTDKVYSLEWMDSAIGLARAALEKLGKP